MAWDFGDGTTSTEADPVHTYTGITELTDFDVALTVTDDDGGTDTVTKTVAVAPPAQTVCDNGSGTFVECGLVLTNAATVHGDDHQPRLHRGRQHADHHRARSGRGGVQRRLQPDRR